MARILYVTQSWYNSKGANIIQVKSMAKAFSNIYSGVDLFLKVENIDAEKKRSQDARALGRVQSVLVPTNRSRLGNFLYNMKVFVQCYGAIRERRYSLVYTRSILFSLMYSFFRLAKHSMLFVELHIPYRNQVELGILKRLNRLKIPFVCISQAIVDELLLQGLDAESMHVLHDAHGFSISSHQEETTLSREGAKVGYFGALSHQKGVSLIQSIIESVTDVRFYVYTKDLDVLCNSSNLVEYRYLKHEEVRSKMVEMDFLLLTIVPQGGANDISPYTSPLKLFEYLSTGVPIIASDVPVLHEIITNGESAMYFSNTVESFRQIIYKAIKQPGQLNTIRKNSIRLARKHTWDNRAQAIENIRRQRILQLRTL